MNRPVAMVGIVGILLSGPLALGAQRPEPTPNPLVSVKSLTCTFLLSVSATWEEGAPKAAVRTGGTLTIRFVDIDTQDGSARIEGAAAHPVAQLSGWNLHFLEIQPAGALTVTTVFAQETSPGKLKAVQTRTDYLPISLPRYVATPTVSQYYGECEPKP